jgi:dienelactone hydrolase
MASTGMAGTMADAGGAGAAGSVGGMTSTAQTLPPITDYTQPGPFKTTVEAKVGPGNNYTIYRPDPLGANGFLHSPIIFGPGIATSCDPLGSLNIYTTLLTHFASHGFVTICVNSLSGSPGAPANLDAMKLGLDWLIAQDSQAGVYQGKLAVDRAIAMGYSIGAGASVNLSSHPAIMTTVVIHDHNTSGDPHGPVLMMTGTMDVIADMRTTLMTLAAAPAVLVALPIGHLNVITEISGGGRYVAPITAWLRYWVNGDQGAKHFFFGADCDVCESPWITPEPNDKWKALP